MPVVSTAATLMPDVLRNAGLRFGHDMEFFYLGDPLVSKSESQAGLVMPDKPIHENCSNPYDIR
jgi:hypothetical protein